MRRNTKKYDIPPFIQPGLFDSLDEPGTGVMGDFELIPPEKIDDLRREMIRTSPLEDMEPQQADDHIFFMSLGSGSSGNCSYVGDRSSGFLIDAGIDGKKVMLSLRDNGIMPEQVKGIILTHDHHDHISQAYPLLRAYRHLKLYCTPRTLNGILRHRNVSRRIKDYHVAVYKEFPFTIGQFTITPFDVSHDSSDNAGFFIEYGAHTLCVATDLGCITPRVDHYMRQARNIVIESNYDYDSLRRGSYPEHLKARILAATGHLDNREAADFIAGIYTPILRNIFLCHLSHDNNTPELATSAMKEALTAKGVAEFTATTISSRDEEDAARPRVFLLPLPRYEHTPLYTLF